MVVVVQLDELVVVCVCVNTVGEANSGKASRGVATYTSGIGQAQESASSAMSEIGQAKRVRVLSQIYFAVFLYVRSPIHCLLPSVL